ncbi:sulfotransferase [Albidovulum sp.]|uniref:sulfotransferase n=1 Tax=Albidovulum sp. TaxID=1872424 RepID=UPI0039B8EEBC
MQKFIVFGLPRSGTTYLMTTLTSHSRIICGGEQFNPWAIIDAHSAIRDPERVKERDYRAVEFGREIFRRYEKSKFLAAGFKFMIGHSLDVLKDIASQDDLRFIYVQRDNKLAQASSWIRAERTQKWAQLEKSPDDDARMPVNLLRLSQLWQEFSTYDFLFSRFLDGLSQPKMCIEYREMFSPDFNRHLTDFLGVPYEAGMRSPLVKQNMNRVIDRFRNPEPIETYFRKMGREHWLGEEI